MDFFYNLYDSLKEVDSSVYAGIALISTVCLGFGSVFYLGKKIEKKSENNKDEGKLEKKLE